MINNQLFGIIQQNRIEWSAHGLKRMLERGISRAAVKYVLAEGEIIEDYPDDKPFPSALCHGIWQKKALHVVMAYDLGLKKIYVITAYWPDEEHFNNDFKIRREL